MQEQGAQAGHTSGLLSNLRVGLPSLLLLNKGLLHTFTALHIQ